MVDLVTDMAVGMAVDTGEVTTRSTTKLIMVMAGMADMEVDRVDQDRDRSTCQSMPLSIASHTTTTIE